MSDSPGSDTHRCAQDLSFAAPPLELGETGDYLTHSGASYDQDRRDTIYWSALDAEVFGSPSFAHQAGVPMH
jgi:hypothetical protein